MAIHFERGKYRDEDSGIEQSLITIERSYDVLLALPEHDTARFFTMEEYRKDSDGKDVNQIFQHLFFDVYNLLKFFWWTSAFKTRQLVEGLQYSYNNNNLLTWLILGRS